MKGRLFERFWRGRRRERSVVGAGAGLGLSIVARIAEEHGARVSVEDRPGGGAVFAVALRPVQTRQAAGPT
ncbi:MAG: ATP-binding protein [Caulobacteraceae bacterium]